MYATYITYSLGPPCTLGADWMKQIHTKAQTLDIHFWWGFAKEGFLWGTPLTQEKSVIGFLQGTQREFYEDDSVLYISIHRCC